MNILPDNKSFEDFIKTLKLKEQEKKELISSLPELSKQRKIILLKYLTKIWLIDKAEEKSLRELEKRWID